MNLFPGRLVATPAGGLNVHFGEQSLALALADAAERWRAWSETALTVGIRPEHLRLRDPGAEGVRATVVDAEYLGHETLLHARIDGMAAPAPVLVVRLAGIRPFDKGQAVGLSVDANRLHLFGADAVSYTHLDV